MDFKEELAKKAGRTKGDGRKEVAGASVEEAAGNAGTERKEGDGRI